MIVWPSQTLTEVWALDVDGHTHHFIVISFHSPNILYEAAVFLWVGEQDEHLLQDLVVLLIQVLLYGVVIQSFLMHLDSLLQFKEAKVAEDLYSIQYAIIPSFDVIAPLLCIMVELMADQQPANSTPMSVSCLVIRFSLYYYLKIQFYETLKYMTHVWILFLAFFS